MRAYEQRATRRLRDDRAREKRWRMGVATADVALLQNLRRICAPAALLEVVLGLDPERDQTEIQRLELGPLSIEHIDHVLTPKYAQAGFEITERAVLLPSEWPEFNTSWAKRLHQNERRRITYLIARAA